jgi:hypothetical protein
MFDRILFSAIAAATLLYAAPVFASEAASNQQCSCCSDGSIHDVDHPLREAKEQKASPERSSEQPDSSDDPFIRNQSFGG